jgi:hypothetical protein
MEFVTIAWLFVLAVTMHNAEEVLLLPAWSQTAGRWHHRVGVWEFRFAVIVLTLLAYGAAGLATVYGKESFGAYLLSGYALTMLLNVFFPHVIATIVMRRYAPGTITALLFNLPVTVLLLQCSLQEGYIPLGKFVWRGPLVVIGIMASIPILFFTGRRLPDCRKS